MPETLPSAGSYWDATVASAIALWMCIQYDRKVSRETLTGQVMTLRKSNWERKDNWTLRQQSPRKRRTKIPENYTPGRLRSQREAGAFCTVLRPLMLE